MAEEMEQAPAPAPLLKDYKDPPAAPLVDLSEFSSWSLYRALIAEFVATLLFLYITIATVISDLQNAATCNTVRVLGIAWAFGGMIFILVYCTAGISDFRLFVVQCLGAICGGGLVKGFQKSYYVRNGGGANVVNTGYSKGTEIMGTFILVCTVLSAIDPKRSARDSHVPVLAPLPIGFAVFMVHLATIPITGTGINPARSFGPAVIYGHKKTWDDQWIFWLGPFIGAALATVYHKAVLRAGVYKALGSFRSHPSTL